MTHLDIKISYEILLIVTVVELAFEVLEFGGIPIAAALPAAAFTLKNELGVVVSIITLPLTAPSGVLPIIVYANGNMVGIVAPR